MRSRSLIGVWTAIGVGIGAAVGSALDTNAAVRGYRCSNRGRGRTPDPGSATACPAERVSHANSRIAQQRHPRDFAKTLARERRHLKFAPIMSASSTSYRRHHRQLAVCV